MKNKVGIGIIGTGFARKVQIPAFAACEGASVVSVASGTIAHAEDTAREFGIGHFTDDWRETVSRDDVDLVCITTPPSLHREMVLFALEHNKHILCEKPMAMTVGEAMEMTEAAAAKNVLALIDHELRFQPGRQKGRSLLHGDEIGKVRHVKYHFQAPHRGDPMLPWNWWSDKSQGGGALGAIASHVIDSFHWFLGTGISSVFCQLRSHVKERSDSAGNLRAVTSDDESHMLLRFADSGLTEDATALVSVSMTEGPRYKNRIEFYGERGAMRIDHRGELFVAPSGESDWAPLEVDMNEPIQGVTDTGFSRGFTGFAPKIVEAIREGRTEIENAAVFADGLAVQKVLDAARESDATGCAVDLGAIDLHG